MFCRMNCFLNTRQGATYNNIDESADVFPTKTCFLFNDAFSSLALSNTFHTCDNIHIHQDNCTSCNIMQFILELIIDRILSVTCQI